MRNQIPRLQRLSNTFPRQRSKSFRIPSNYPQLMTSIKDFNYKEQLRKSFLTQFNIDSSKRVLLFLGRVHPVKGLERLIEAWLSVYEQFGEWCLVIVGPDENGYRSKLKSMLNHQTRNRNLQAKTHIEDRDWCLFY